VAFLIDTSLVIKTITVATKITEADAEVITAGNKPFKVRDKRGHTKATRVARTISSSNKMVVKLSSHLAETFSKSPMIQACTLPIRDKEMTTIVAMVVEVAINSKIKVGIINKISNNRDNRITISIQCTSSMGNNLPRITTVR